MLTGPNFADDVWSIPREEERDTRDCEEEEEEEEEEESDDE